MIYVGLKDDPESQMAVLAALTRKVPIEWGPVGLADVVRGGPFAFVD